MLMNIIEEYTSLISTIETGWADGATNLSNTIPQIIRHSEIMKGHVKEKILLTIGIHRAPKGKRSHSQQRLLPTQKSIRPRQPRSTER